MSDSRMSGDDRARAAASLAAGADATIQEDAG
jgi:hypothetical protein